MTRVYERLRAPFRRRVLPRLAVLHRRRLRRTTFIGIVGSAGKTMTKYMSAAVLNSKYRGSFRENSANFELAIPESILMARPSDQFCVVELSAGEGPGSLITPLSLLTPSIGVITCIGTDHYSAFGSQEAIAAEKGRLIRELPENGVGILNADDPYVIAMRAECKARVISYGLSSDADVRAEAVTSRWPDRLSFELIHKGSRVHVETRMCGEHWVTGALAAAAVGIAMDVELGDIARALSTVEPFKARMSPLALPDGVTFIRDDVKASTHTIPPAFEFLRSARAKRKLAIIGTISDYSGRSRLQYEKTARYALDVADVVIFVGPRASVTLRAKPLDDPERLQAFSTVKAATAFLSDFLTAGDLVLLKGSNQADHLYRIPLSRMSPVTCWRENCRRLRFCDKCELVRAQPKSQVIESSEQSHVPERAAVAAMLGGDDNILVGLGNLGNEYTNTPHNVGHAVLDRIATETKATWIEESGIVVTRVHWRDIPLSLVKLQCFVNNSGPVLRSVFDSSGIKPDRVVLLFDDIDLPLGKVRIRARGSDGGHRGVRSILESFQTDEFRRIKIGVQRGLEGEQARDAVLRPFSEAEQPVIRDAVETACCRLSELVKSGDRGGSTRKVNATNR